MTFGGGWTVAERPAYSRRRERHPSDRIGDGHDGMGKHDKTLQQVLLGRADANIAFADLRGLLLALGFDERIRGDHHIFPRDGVEEIMNLQPVGAKAKAYQVRQVRSACIRYKLEL